VSALTLQRARGSVPTSLGLILAFELSDFVDASRMPAALEFGVHPDFDEALGNSRTQQIAR
jgi:hypothetical protein